MKIPKIEYDIYYKYNDTNGTHLKKLNLDICENDRIDILIPISISEDFDELNMSSGYYNDICVR